MRFIAKLREGLRRLVASVEEGKDVVAAPVAPVREVFRRFWPHARPYRRWFPLVLVFTFGPLFRAYHQPLSSRESLAFPSRVSIFSGQPGMRSLKIP